MTRGILTDSARPSDGVLVSALTVTAYLMAFAHKAGTALAFGIPFELIDLQLIPTLLATLLPLAVLLGVFIFAADPLFALLSAPKADGHPAVKAIRPPLGTLLILYALWLMGGSAIPPAVFWSAVPALVIFGVLPLVKPLFMYRDVPGYIEKLRAYYKAEGERQAPLNRVLFGSFGWVTHLSVLTLVLAVLSFGFGYARAKGQQVFFVTNQHPETVVLQIYGDRVIAAEFLRPEKRVKRVYHILKVDTAGLVLRQETIGPLSLED
jgi:hypothetical protein